MTAGVRPFQALACWQSKPVCGGARLCGKSDVPVPPIHADTDAHTSVGAALEIRQTPLCP